MNKVTQEVEFKERSGDTKATKGTEGADQGEEELARRVSQTQKESREEELVDRVIHCRDGAGQAGPRSN